MEAALFATVVVTAIICATTAPVVHRDGYRPQPARPNFDSRQPSP